MAPPDGVTATAPRPLEKLVESGAAPAAPLSHLMKKAALWSGLNSFVLRLSQFAVGVVSARLIAPHQFGIFAVALTVYAVIVNVNELGVSAALARTTRSVAEVAPTVATIALMSSATFTTAMFLSAPWLASMLGAPAAANAVRILSVTVLVGGVTAVPYALLVRNFEQKKRFVADSSNFVVSTIFVVVLGVAGLGATALAVSRVAGQLASLVLLTTTIKPRYRPGWNRERAREILHFSLPLAGATVIEFTLGNIDYIVVGRILGPLSLGYYALAYNISGWPVSVFGLMINEVALPAFARAQDDAQSLPRRVSGAFRLTAAMALPVSALCLALAHPLVVSVYGSRWGAAASTLAVLGAFGSLRIIMTLFSNILAALGKSRQVLYLQLVWIAFLIPALIVGVQRYGIVGAAFAQEAVALIVVLPLGLTFVSRAGGGRISSLLAGCALPAGAALAAGWCAWGVTEIVPHALVDVFAGGAVGLLVYTALVWRWLRALMKEARSQWDGPEGGPGPAGAPVAACSTHSADRLPVEENPVSFGDYHGVAVIVAANPWDGIRMADQQLADALADHMPVLYVDPPTSFVTRRKRPELAFDRHAGRLLELRPGLARLVPEALPGLTRAGVARANSTLLAWQIRRAVGKLDGSVNALIDARVLSPVLGRCGEKVSIYWAQDDFVGLAPLLGLDPDRLRRGEQYMARRAQQIIAANPQVADSIRRDGYQPHLIPFGCDYEHFLTTADVQPAADISLRAPFAVFMGHVGDRIDAAILSAVVDRGIRLLVVGPQHGYADADRLAELLRSPNVQWVGAKDFDELPRYLAPAAVGILPYNHSKFNEGSFPLKTLEYLAAGLPVVATDLPAIRWLGGPDIVVADEPQSFADAVEALVVLGRDDDGDARRRSFAQAHSWNERAAAFAELIGVPSEHRRRGGRRSDREIAPDAHSGAGSGRPDQP
jgi:O-antigen/teichoic acid export membrane protein/glycosyltransferase involved in cell wall biosynthesis